MPKSLRPKLVTTVHGLYSVSKYSEIMCRGEAVIAVSETVREYIYSNYPNTPHERVHLIYRGVDPIEFPYGYKPDSEWKEKFFSDYPNARGKKLLCLPGRLTRLKGHNDFIDLIDKLSKNRDDIHGIVVGGVDPKRKEYAQELYDRVQTLGLENHITFTGARSDIREVFGISDVVYSLSSKPESFGRTVLEALSLGIPVIGYDHGGVGEILQKVYPTGKVEIRNSQELERASLLMIRTPLDVRNVKVLSKIDMLRSTLEVYQRLSCIS